MFTSPTKRKKKTTAQAMVEFALALPVLLLVVYGLIEAGRLMFIYASVVTAARQAVRYGSATGDNGSGKPYYQDCSGIIASANNVAFINPLSNIQITYDTGPGTTSLGSCQSQALTPSNIKNGYRIRVQVSSQYAPIVPLVPFGPFTITSSSSRTLLESISIGATSLPTNNIFGSGGIYLQITSAVSQGSGGNVPNSAYYYWAGNIITYTYIITNASTISVSGPFTIVDPLTTWSCSGAASTLAPSDSTTCTGTYTVTQTDVDNGSVVSTASAVATTNSFTTNTVNTLVSAIQTPALFLTKSSNVTMATPGNTITYTYVLKNTGNVTLSQPFTISDTKLGTISCSGTTLAPGAPLTCTKSYIVTSADGTTGYITNTATASAVFGTQNITSNSPSVTVGTRALFLSVTSSPAMPVNGPIQFTFNLKNAGSTSMNGVFAVAASPSIGTITCTQPGGGSLSSGGVVTCTGTYSPSQADIDAGVFIDTFTASATNGSTLSNPVTASVSIYQSPQLTLTISPSPTLALTVGQVVNYTYTLKNSGNVTLLQPYSVSDDKVPSINCASATSPLAPGASTTCTGSYTIAQSDIDAGSVIDHATAAGKTQTGFTPRSAIATSTVITYNAPRLGLQKSSNPTVANSAGQIITYTYTLQNTGNTPLTSPYTVTDNKISGSVNCSAAVSPIPIGGSTTCTATYTVTTSDITAKSVVNTATATAMAGASVLTSNQATATVATGTVSCDPRHSGLQTSPFSMTIFNESPIVTITIAQIQVYYDAQNPLGQFINTLQFGGTTIWAGASSGSPSFFNAPFNGTVTLAAGGNKLLNATFNSNYIVDGSERILVTFAENGCPILDSGNNSQLP